MSRRRPVAALLLLTACINSSGAPGDLCWGPTDCAPFECVCADGRRQAAYVCTKGGVCASEHEACASSCADP